MFSSSSSSFREAMTYGPDSLYKPSPVERELEKICWFFSLCLKDSEAASSADLSPGPTFVENPQTAGPVLIQKQHQATRQIRIPYSCGM